MKEEKITVYTCENCGLKFYDKASANSHEMFCLARTKAKKVVVTLLGLNLEEPFDIYMTTHHLVSEHDLYQVYTIGPNCENERLNSIEIWYMYISEKDSVEDAIRLMKPKILSELTKLKNNFEDGLDKLITTWGNNRH